MYRFPFAFSAAALTLAACTPSAISNNRSIEPSYSETIGQEGTEILPVVDGYTIITGSINGRDGFRIMFDTGAQATALFDGPRIGALDLETSGRVSVSGTGDGGGVNGAFAEPLDFMLAGATYEGFTPIVFQWEELPFFPTEAAVFMDAITGHDVYTRFIVDVDHGARSFRLHPFGSPLSDLPEDAVTLPLGVRNGALYVDGRVQMEDGAPPVALEFLIDSGDIGSITLAESSHPSFTPSSDAIDIQSAGISGLSSSKFQRIGAFEIGDFRLENAGVNFKTEPDPSMSADGGRIGAEILNRFRYIIDYDRRELTLVPNKASTAPFPTEAAAEMRLAAIGADLDRLIVVGVQPGGVAERAGLKAGDVIVSIDATPAAEIVPMGVRSMLSGRTEGDTAVFCREGDDPSAGDCARVELVQR